MGMVMELVRVSANELDAYKTGDQLRAQIFDGEGDAQSLYLDKAWHSLHFLLCGEAWSAKGDLGQALMGGEETELDFGYGPVSCVSPSQVRKTAKALAAVDAETLHEKYDADEMVDEDIYPSIWDEPEAVEYPLSFLESLQEFYAAAAEAGDAVFVVIS